jgi:hypothetical protein
MSSGPPLNRSLSPQVRSLISLLLFMHLFCVFFCLFSVYAPSRFQQRLLGVLSPYTQSMNIDLDYAPYYLTRDTLLDETFNTFQEREYRVEVLPHGADATDAASWIKLGENWWGTGPSYRRLQRLAFLPVGSTAEERQSAIALSLARLGEQQIGQPVARLRVRQHVPLPQVYIEENLPHDIDDEIWFKLAYQAIIVGDSVLPVVPEGEAAPLLSEPDSN